MLGAPRKSRRRLGICDGSLRIHTRPDKGRDDGGLTRLIPGYPPAWNRRPQWVADLSARPHSELRTMNLCHVVVTGGGWITVVPINRDPAPRRTSDRALVFHVALPANAVA